MNAFVLDASVTLAWLIDKATHPYAKLVRELLENEGRAVVPALWQLELANGFVVAERRGVLTATDSTEILQRFEMTFGDLIEIKQDAVSIRQLIALARETHLTAYDASYLMLAKQFQIPIATLDRDLAQAAERVGVRLLR